MKLYGKYLSMYFKSVMEYKVSTVITLLGQFLVSFTAYLAVYFLFLLVNQVDNFAFAEVMLCFAVTTMAFAMAEMVFRGLDTFSMVISNGEFDRMLVRPRSLLFQVFASKFDIARLGRLLQGILVLCYALPGSGVVWTWDKILTLCLMIFSGALLFGMLFLLYAAFCFFTIEGLEFMNIFTYGSREFATYPLSIYGNGVLKFLTYVIPIACFQYYPLLYLIGRVESPLYILTPFACLVFAVPCFLFWRYGVRRYKSTGS